METGDLMPILFLSYTSIIAVVLITSEMLSARWFKKSLHEAIQNPANRKENIRKAFQNTVNQAWTSVTIMGGILVVLSLIFGKDFQNTAILVGFSLLAVIIIGGLMMNGSLDSVKRTGVVKEFRRIMEKGDRGQFNDLAEGVLDFGKYRFTLLAVHAMERWGAPDVIPMLEKIHYSTKSGFMVASPGLKDIARTALERVRFEENLLRRPEERIWVQQGKVFRFPRRVMQAASQKNPAAFKGLMDGLSPKAYPAPFRQFQMHQSHPDLVCRNCRTRAEKVPHDFGSFVYCRICGDDHFLEGGIKRLVGRIGDGVDWEKQGKTLFVALWDAAQKEPRYADIDALAFGPLEADQADWAIAGVLETLRNKLPQNKIPIPLENKPPKQLSNNALHQLRTITS